MKRALKFFAAFAAAYPKSTAWATMLLLGAGAVGGVALLTTPTIVPQPTAFMSNGSGAAVNNALKPNGGTAGQAFLLPTTATNSFGILVDASVAPSLLGNNEYLLGEGTVGVGLELSGNTTGIPSFFFQKSGNWWNGFGLNMSNTVTHPATWNGVGSYNSGYYPFTATGCAGRQPAAFFSTSTDVTITDPGFLCNTPPTASLTNVQGTGARQNTGASFATTCAANSPVAGNFTVTASVAVPHQYVAGQTYTLQGFTPTGYNTTYTALPGTSGTTLVGTPSTATTGTCPATVSAEGTAFGGVGGTLPFAAISTTQGATGVTTKNNQHFCAIVGENGADSPFPGSQYFSAVDDHGNPLPGAPSLIPYLNQGVTNFTGYVTKGLQSGSGTFTASVANILGSLTISGATYNAGASGIGSQTGFVTFTLSSSHGLSVGDTFTIAGIVNSPTSPNLYNAVYQVLSGSTGSTLIGSLASGGNLGAAGTYSSGGVIGSGNTLTVTTTPTNQAILRSSGSLTGTGIISTGVTIASQTSGSPPVGQQGVYVLSHNVGTTTASTLTVTVATTPAVTVTALNKYTIVSASYSGTTGYVTFTAPAPATITGASFSGGNATFTTSTASGVAPGGLFSVSGTVAATIPGGYNALYVAQAGSSGTTIIGTPNTGTLVNPGTYSSGGTLFVAPMVEPGMEFTVSGATPSGYNRTYVAVAGTSTITTGPSGAATLVGNPLSGPIGTPQAISNPGSYVSGGTFASLIMPNSLVFGTVLNNANSLLAPFGTLGGTGTGGVGTYALTATPVVVVGSFPIASGGVVTISGDTLQNFVPGLDFTYTDASTSLPASGNVIGYGSGSGLNGTYPTTAANGSTGNPTYTGGIWSSTAPGIIFDGPIFYQALGGVAGTVTSPSTQFTVGFHSQSFLADFIQGIGTQTTAGTAGATDNGWSGDVGNVAMVWMPGTAPGLGGFPTQAGGSPSTSSLASLCKKQTDIQQFSSTNSFTVHSLYRLNDPGIWADSGAAQFTGSITGATGSTATLNVVSTQTGSTTALPNGTVIGGVGFCANSVCPTTTSGSGSTYALSFGSASAVNITSEAMTAGAFQPALPLAVSNFNGWIDQPGGAGTAVLLHVGATTNSTQVPQATFTGTLNTKFTASLSGNTLTVTSPVIGGNGGAEVNPYIGVGTTITIPGGTPATDTVAAIVGAAQGANGTYTMTSTQPSPIASTTMFASGILPGLATNLTVTSVTGSPSASMLVTDSTTIGVTGPPIQLVGGVTSGNIPIVPTYYSPSSVVADSMTATNSTLVPNQYVYNSLITNPVKVLSYGTGTFGLTGTYVLNGCPNAACAVGTSGAQVAFTTSGITDGAPVPTPALTVRDLGPGTTLPVTNSTISCSGLGSCTATGSVPLSGTYDTSVIGGTPTIIQAQVSLTAGGPPVSGCSACAWTNLSSYTATPLTMTASISTGGVMTPSVFSAPTLGVGQAITGSGYSGTVTGINTSGQIPTYTVTPSPGSPIGPETITATNVFSWSGSAINIPPATGPLYVAVRASNGTAYAMLQNSIRIGLVFEFEGEGQTGVVFSPGEGGNAISSFTGLFGTITGPGSFEGTPPIAGYLSASGSTVPNSNDRFDISGVGTAEGGANLQQGLTTAFGGWPTWAIPIPRDGIGIEPEIFGQASQTQTVDIGDGSTTTFCSAAIYCSNASTAGALVFNAASLGGASITAEISDGSGGVGAPGNILSLSGTGTFNATITGTVMNVTTAPTNLFQLRPGVVVTGTGINANTTIVSLGTGVGSTGTYNLSPTPGGTGSLQAVAASLNGNSTYFGALQPGATLTDTTGNITGSPTLQSCLTGCIPNAFGGGVSAPFCVGNCYPMTQTWTVSGSPQLVATESMRSDTGTSPWPLYSGQISYPLIGNGNFGQMLVKAGTFNISVNGTVVCQDTTPLWTPFNNQGGNCTGAGVASSFVNYQTGDYQVTFTSAPAANAVITASWTNLVSPDNGNLSAERPGGYDFFGDPGVPAVGYVSSVYSKSPGGVNAHIYMGGQAAQAILGVQGFPFGVGYSNMVSWLYDTRFPTPSPA